MTRWARGGNSGKKKPCDASSWEEMKQSLGKQSPRGKKRQERDDIARDKVKQKKTGAEDGMDKFTPRKKKQKVSSGGKFPGGNQGASRSKTVCTAVAGTSQQPTSSSKKSLVDVLLEADKASAKKGTQGIANVAGETEVSLVSPISERALWKRKKRSEERRLKRQQRKSDNMVCFHCRQSGHGVADCPEMLGDVEQGTGICFRCGSTEHDIRTCTAKADKDLGEFPYAKCFICGQNGHLSRTCPENPRGLYPEGGACKECGSVEHRWWNCPVKKPVKGVNIASAAAAFTVSKTERTSADAEPAFLSRPKVKVKKNGPKVVVF